MVSAKVVASTAFCTAPVFHTDREIVRLDGPEPDQHEQAGQGRHGDVAD